MEANPRVILLAQQFGGENDRHDHDQEQNKHTTSCMYATQKYVDEAPCAQKNLGAQTGEPHCDRRHTETGKTGGHLSGAKHRGSAPGAPTGGRVCRRLEPAERPRAEASKG